MANCILSPRVALQIGAVAFIPGVPLDVVLGFPTGCYMYLFADILSIPITGTNTCQPNIAYNILTIPNDNSIVGTTLYMQIIGINDVRPSTGWVTQAIQVIVFP